MDFRHASAKERKSGWCRRECLRPVTGLMGQYWLSELREVLEGIFWVVEIKKHRLKFRVGAFLDQSFGARRKPDCMSSKIQSNSEYSI